MCRDKRTYDLPGGKRLSFLRCDAKIPSRAQIGCGATLGLSMNIISSKPSIKIQGKNAQPGPGVAIVIIIIISRRNAYRNFSVLILLMMIPRRTLDNTLDPICVGQLAVPFMDMARLPHQTATTPHTTTLVASSWGPWQGRAGSGIMPLSWAPAVLCAPLPRCTPETVLPAACVGGPVLSRPARSASPPPPSMGADTGP